MQVTPERRPNGKPVKIPVEMTESRVDQLAKVWLEIADYSRMDGHLVVSHFRLYHGKDWTLRVLRRIVQELHEPRIDLHLSEPRAAFVPMYDELLRRHEQAADADFSLETDRSALPL